MIRGHMAIRFASNASHDSISLERAAGAPLTFSQRLHEILTGFERPFWIANLSEIFERLSYYGAFASLALYLQQRLNFSAQETGTLTGLFGGMFVGGVLVAGWAMWLIRR